MSPLLHPHDRGISTPPWQIFWFGSLRHSTSMCCELFSMCVPTWFVEGTDVLAISNNGDHPRGKLFLLACGVHQQNCAGKEQNKSSFTTTHTLPHIPLLVIKHTPIGNKNNQFYSTNSLSCSFFSFFLTTVEYC